VRDQCPRLFNLCSSTDISIRMMSDGDEKMHTEVWPENLKGRDQLPVCRWEDNIKMGQGEGLVKDCVPWSQLNAFCRECYIRQISGSLS
jgi:hypothetical protein